MKYKFEKEKMNYSDFASGRVLYNRKGATAFPVRLASEIYQRSKKYLNEEGVSTPFSIYDPCCGGAYLLTTLGFLHGEDFSQIIASDVDEEMIDLAGDNLSLLTIEGINYRIDELNDYIEKFNKDSHRKALKSAQRLKLKLKNKNFSFDINCFQADVLKNFVSDIKTDLIITDLPYGNIVSWSQDKENNMKIFLDNMLQVIKPNSILALITEKKQVIEPEKFTRIKHFTIGKRRVSFLTLK